MADKYFENFPLVTYSNNQVVDITRRVTLLDRVSRSPYIFFEYDIEDFERPDQLSNRYYDDPFKSWILYLTNKITDPYFEWYLDNQEFNQLLEKKYGSFINAINKIKYFRNDWENQENISVSAYNSLANSMKKYWNPVYGNGSNIISYERKNEDWISNTNKVISYNLSSNSNFIKDEICEVKINNNTTGKGQVSKVANNVLYLQHVSGSFFDSDELPLNSNSYVYGTESNSNVVVTEITAIANNISEEELIYWKPITYFDYETETNEYNKSIRVIDKDLRFTAVDNLRFLLSEE